MDKILIGSHSVSIFKKGYKKVYRTIYIEEGETLEENITLKEVQSSNESSSSNGYKSKNTRKKDPLVTFGVEAGLDVGTKESLPWTGSMGLLMRIGRCNSRLQLIMGGKYQYLRCSDYVSFRYKDGPNSYDYGYASTDYVLNVHQMVVPVYLNLNYEGLYVGIGYEHGFLISKSEKFKDSSSGFRSSLLYTSEEYSEYKSLIGAARNLVLNFGFSSRHFDWRLYAKIGLKKDTAGWLGSSLTYYF